MQEYRNPPPLKTSENPMIFSANRAAKEANIAKKTLLEALTSGRLSATKNGKGHWEIESSELFRVFPKTGENTDAPLGSENRSASSEALQVEVRMLREQIELVKAHGEQQVEQLERQLTDYRQTLALLSDQKDREEKQPRGFWAKLFR